MCLRCQFAGGSGGHDFKDKKAVEESEKSCVEISRTPRGLERGNSTRVCEAEHPLVHLALLSRQKCVGVLACAYAKSALHPPELSVHNQTAHNLGIRRRFKSLHFFVASNS